MVSHPIQHFCPMYAQLASTPLWDVHVLFAYYLGSRSYFDKGFGREVNWDGLRLNTFSHEFLNSEAPETIIPSQVDSRKTEDRLNAYSPDIVIIYGYIQPLQRRALNWANKLHIPVFMISDSELRSQRIWYRDLAKRIVIPPILRKVSAFLTTGDSNEDYYQRYGASPLNMYRTPFPIDIELYERAFADRVSLRSRLRGLHEISDDQIVVTMVGKFESRKRQRDLIEALAKCGDSASQVVLVFVGSGPLETELRNLAEKEVGARVIFAGFVSPQDLPGYYAATDVYAHASNYDPHPLAISEAIYMGCPIIASSAIGSVGPTDDVQIGANGLCFPVGNPNALQAMLLRFIQSPQMRSAFGTRSHQIAVDNQSRANGGGLRQALIGIGKLSS